jgi:hypothetical protein
VRNSKTLPGKIAEGSIFGTRVAQIVSPRSLQPIGHWLLLCLALVLLAPQLWAREKDGVQYGAGLIVNVPFPEAQVIQVVQDVAQNGIIRGTREYSKDEYISGASLAPSTRVFPDWAEPGKVFFKVKLRALNPQNFKDTNDVGTLVVRYVVQGQDDKHTVLHIDARFVEDYRRVAHASNGSVEGAEYQTIHNRLDAIDAMNKGTAEAEKANQEPALKEPPPVDQNQSVAQVAVPAITDTMSTSQAATNREPSPSTAPQTLEERVQDLRRQVERLVKAPGAPLKSAPFHSASTLQSLPTGTQVLIEVATPYWLGVETHQGQHGWVLRDDLELLP